MYREIKKVQIGGYEVLVFESGDPARGDNFHEVRITDNEKGGEVFIDNAGILRDVAQELLRIWGAELLESKSDNRPV